MTESNDIPKHVSNVVSWAESHTQDLEPWPGGPFEKKLPQGDLVDLTSIPVRFMSWVALRVLEARRQGALHCTINVHDYVHGVPSEFAFSRTLDLGLAGIAALPGAKKLLSAAELAAAKKITASLRLIKRSLTDAGALTYGHAYVHGSGIASNLVSLTISLGAMSEERSERHGFSQRSRLIVNTCPCCGSAPRDAAEALFPRTR